MKQKPYSRSLKEQRQYEGHNQQRKQAGYAFEARQVIQVRISAYDGQGDGHRNDGQEKDEDIDRQQIGLKEEESIGCEGRRERSGNTAQVDQDRIDVLVRGVVASTSAVQPSVYEREKRHDGEQSNQDNRVFTQKVNNVNDAHRPPPYLPSNRTPQENGSSACTSRQYTSLGLVQCAQHSLRTSLFWLRSRFLSEQVI